MPLTKRGVRDRSSPSVPTVGSLASCQADGPALGRPSWLTVWVHVRRGRGAGWEQSGVLNGVELHSTAPNGIRPDLRSCVSAGQSRCSVLLHTGALNGAERTPTVLNVRW